MTKQPFSYPVRAWTVWFLSALFMFYKYAIEVSPSVMTKSLMQTFHIGGVELGYLAASYLIAYLILQIPAGLLLDRFGPRKVTTLAIILCGLGNLVFAGAHSLFMAEVGRFLTGIGAAFAAVNCLKLIANWFPLTRFAFMTGLMMSVAMLGAVGGQAPLAAFIRKMEWRQAIAIIGVAGLILAAIFWIVIRDKAPDHQRERHIVPTKISFLTSLKAICKNGQSWWLSIYSCLAFAPVMVFGGLWGVSFITAISEVPEHRAAQMVSLIFIGFAIGAPLFGWCSERVGLRRPIIFWGTFFALIALSIIIYVPTLSPLSIALLLLIFGFLISSFLLSFTMIREIHLPLFAATATGFMNTFDALLGAIADPVTGKLLDTMWDGTLFHGARVFSADSYKTSFATLVGFLLLSLLIVYKVKETHCKSLSPSSLP